MAAPDNDALRRAMRSLAAEIRRHDALYHEQDAPEISDADYDRLFAELKALEESHPDLVEEDSPTRRAGGAPSRAFAPVRHPAPMLSLDKAHSLEEWRSFAEKRAKDLGRAVEAWSCALKFDGLAMELLYDEKGVLKTAATRGDGTTGEDVTHTVRTVAGVPSKIPEGPWVVRGEILLSKDGLARMNREREAQDLPLYANCRNAAAGSVRNLDPAVAAGRPLRFTAYSLLAPGEEGRVPPSAGEQRARLRALGLDVDARCRTVRGSAGVEAYFTEMEALRDALDFEVDGVVVRIESQADFDGLGVAGRRPRGAVALKFPPQIAETVLKDVTFQVGRTGVLTPVGHLEPVAVSGAMVSRVTLHNEAEVRRKDLRIGDRVRLVRSGEVIPKILEAVASVRTGAEKPVVFPSACPRCGTEVERDGEEGVLLRCPSPACPAKQAERLIHFVSKGAMNLDGLGEEVVRELLDKGLVREPADLFRLRAEDLDRLERMGEKRRENLLKAVEAARRPSLDRFLFALNIRGVGEKTAKVLARKCGTAEAFLALDPASLLDLDDMGEVTVQQLGDFLRDDARTAEVRRLLDAGVVPQAPAASSAGGPLAGMKVLFTGSLQLPRRIAKERAEAAGAEVVSSLSKNVSVLIVGADPGSKATKAAELGVPVWTEAEFLEKIGAS